MELAGLEPATSWVRFRRKPLRPVAMHRDGRDRAVSPRRAFATVCRSSPRLLDQNLTTEGARSSFGTGSLARRGCAARRRSTRSGDGTGDGQWLDVPSTERRTPTKASPYDGLKTLG